jgi:uncharacterized repeat protein (TIGR03803 family)
MRRIQFPTDFKFKFLMAIVIALLLIASAVAQTEAVIYTFQGSRDGAYPYAGLVADSSGALYGTTYRGGDFSCSCGTVFKLIPPATAGGLWTKITLYRFLGGNDGAYPYGGVTIDAEGNLYGTTEQGGGSAQCGGCGVVFRLTPPAAQGSAWTESLLHVFDGYTDGGGPTAPPILDAQGNLDGVTWSGGPMQQGTVYQLSPASDGSWNLTNLHAFGASGDGEDPAGQLVLDAAGNLYGTTANGGRAYNGVAFKLTKPSSGTMWAETILHSFQGGSDGAAPYAGLTFDQSGNLYGTTTNPAGGGTVFKLKPLSAQMAAWTESVLYDFTGGSDGSQPFAGVVLDAKGNVYGATSDYDSGGDGAFFQLSPPSMQGSGWTEVTLHAFSSGADGAQPFVSTPLLWHGVLYGTTSEGGSAGFGTVYSILP